METKCVLPEVKRDANAVCYMFKQARSVRSALRSLRKIEMVMDDTQANDHAATTLRMSLCVTFDALTVNIADAMIQNNDVQGIAALIRQSM